MFKVNGKKPPQPKRSPVKKEDRSIPSRPVRNGRYQPQQPPMPDPRPVKK
jgi:hypothetical protein